MSEPVIAMSSVAAVDEQTIDQAFSLLGTRWPRTSIAWPKAYNDLISVVSNGVDRFNEVSSQCAEDDFIKDAPPALTKALTARNCIQERLPHLVQRAQDFDRRSLRLAVKWFLLWGGFSLHRHLIHIASWRGFSLLELEIPPEVISLGPTIYRDEKSLARIFGEEAEIYTGRLHSIGDHAILPRDDYIYLWASKNVLTGFGIEVTDPVEICTWLIPQIELSFLYDGSKRHDVTLPDKYVGPWKFSVIKDADGGEIWRRKRD